MMGNKGQGATGNTTQSPTIVGSPASRILMFAFARRAHRPFNINGQYVGEGKIYLNYDGHPGFDFQTTDQDWTGKIPVLAAVDGKIVCVRVPENPSDCHDRRPVPRCTEG